MNAYELAKAQQAYSPQTLEEIIKQQADRIAELEETIEACYAVQEMQAEEVYKGNDRIAELEKELKRTKFAWNLAENEIERLSNKDRSGNSISAEEYQKTHEGFSTIIDKTTPQTKPLSDEEIIQIRQTVKANNTANWADTLAFARAIEERHGIK